MGDLLTEDDMIDEVMEYLDESFCAGRFADVDARIAGLDVSGLPSSVAYCWAISTGWGDAWRHLENRPALIERVRARVAELKGREYADELLGNPTFGRTPDAP